MRYLLLLCCFVTAAWAQKQTPAKAVDSKVERVTVYEKGAQVTRSFQTPIAIGKTQFVVKGVSPQLDKNSVQVQGKGNFTITSVVHQASFQGNESLNDERAKLEDLKQVVEDKTALEKGMLNVYQQEQTMLLKNQEISGKSTAVKVAELKESIDFHRNRLTEVTVKQLEINRNIKKLEEELLRLNTRLNAFQPAQEVHGSEIVLTISANEMNANASMEISYFVPNAGWKPSYDVRVKDIDHELEVGYKAEVFQYSGEDWHNVSLSLSTANPKKSGVSPALKTWYWGTPNDYSSYYNAVFIPNADNNEVIGQVRNKADKTPLPGVYISLKGTSLGAVTDVNGHYKITLPPDRSRGEKILIFHFVGMKSETRYVAGNVVNVDMEMETKALQEVVSVGYGVDRKRAITGSVAEINPKPATQIIEMEEDETPVSQTYDIKLPYSVPSDGKVYSVEIKTQQVPAYYEYVCVPKIDRDAFLTAHITDWEKYGFLEGEVNLFMEGVFVGKSSLHIPNSDTLAISLGRDKSILVSRSKQKEFTEKQTFGSFKTEARAYEIVVRNTRKQAVNIVLQDQFPISNLKEIEIKDRKAPDAEIDPENGRIAWRLKVEPAKETKLHFSYRVKYPKTGVAGSE